MALHKNIIYCIVAAVLLASCGKSFEETQPVREDIVITVFASGTLQAANSYEVTARADGYIENLTFEENDIIEKGQLLALIDNQQNKLSAKSSETLYQIAKSNATSNAPKLVQARNTAEVAQEQMKQDSAVAMKYKRLSDLRAIAKIDYETKSLTYQNSKKEYKNALEQYQLQKKLAEEQLVINRSQKEINQTLSSYNQVRATSAGKIYKKYKEVGDFVRQGEAIAMIGNPNNLYAKVSIDEQSVAKIKVGQEALIQLNIDKEKEYRGNVFEILPTFDESSQSFLAKIAFSKPVEFKIVNTQLQANIIIDEVENALLVPRRFLGYGNEVMVKGAKDPTKIETKIVSSKWVQVLSGLDEDAIIVVQK